MKFFQPDLNIQSIIRSHVGRISKFASDYDINETQLDSVWKLGRLLLEAGADPTNHHSTSDRPYHDLLSLVLVSNNFVRGNALSQILSLLTASRIR